MKEEGTVTIRKTKTRPSPPVPFDADVTNYPSFMLNTERLLTSTFTSKTNGDEFKAGVMLWCAAWKQRPAGSLPADEPLLASFAKVTWKKWKKIRKVAMRGFVKCTDGRWYHFVLCEDVLRLLDTRTSNKNRTVAATEARKNQRHGPRDVQRDDERHDQRNDSRNDQRNVVPSTSSSTANSSNDLTTVSVETGVVAPSGARTAESAPAPQPNTPPPPKPTPRGHRLPDDWQPSIDNQNWAIAELSEAGFDPARVFNQFQDYWKASSGRNATKQDWNAAWRVWVRKEIDQRRKPTKHQSTNPLFDAAMRKLSEGS